MHALKVTEPLHIRFKLLEEGIHSNSLNFNPILLLLLTLLSNLSHVVKAKMVFDVTSMSVHSQSYKLYNTSSIQYMPTWPLASMKVKAL